MSETAESMARPAVGGERGTYRFVEEEASQHATVGEEGEKLKAELPAGFDLRREDRDAGDELGRHGGTGGPREDAREGERRRNRGEWGREHVTRRVRHPPRPRMHTCKGVRRHGRPSTAAWHKGATTPLWKGRGKREGG